MLKEILNIGSYPELNRDRPFINKLATVLKTYGLVFLSLFFVGPLASAADHFVTQALHYKSIIKQDDITMQQMMRKLGYWTALVIICLLGPLLEETVFRLPLSFKRNHVAWSIALAMFIGGNTIFKHSIIAEVLMIFLSAAVWLMIKYLIPHGFGQRLNPYKSYFIVASITVFGLMHISNYSPLQWPIIFIYPVFVLPQVCMGWGMTYVRFKNGFFWGVGLHCLINTVAMILFARFK